MKVLKSLMIFAVIFSCVQAELPKIGTCTFQDYTLKSRSCITSFIHTLQKNPKSNCSTELDTFVDCAVKKVLVCFTGMTAALLKPGLKKALTKEMMCDKAGMQFPGPAGGMNATIPCNITVVQYTSKINGCSDKILKMWQANKADTGTCWEFKTTKTCVSEFIYDHCQVSGDLEEAMKLQLDNYNPFCSNGVDPTSAPTTAATPSNPRSASQTTPLKGFLVLFIPAALVFMGN